MGDSKDGCTDRLDLDNSEAVIDCFRWFCARMGSPTDFFDATVNIYLCIWWNWLTPPITFSFFNWPLISLFQLMGISWGFWGYFRISLPTSLDENLCEPVHIFRGFKGDLKMVGLNGINETMMIITLEDDLFWQYSRKTVYAFMYIRLTCYGGLSFCDIVIY